MRELMLVQRGPESFPATPATILAGWGQKIKEHALSQQRRKRQKSPKMAKKWCNVGIKYVETSYMAVQKLPGVHPTITTDDADQLEAAK